MACFKRMFGIKSKKKQAESKSENSIKEAQSILEQRQQELDKEIDECMKLAKENVNTNQRAAMRALEKKKRLEKTLQNIDEKLAVIDLRRDALQDAKNNALVLQMMKTTEQSLKRAHGKLNKVHNLMDNISEQHYVGSEISSSIRKSLVSFDVDDEEELERELQQLKEGQFKRSHSTTIFPSIPSAIDVFTDEKECEDTESNIGTPRKQQNETI